MKFGLLLRAHRQYNSSGGGAHVHVLDIPEELICDIKVTAGLVLLSVITPHNKESGAAPSVTSLQFYSRRYRRTVGPGGKCSSLKCNFIPATEMRQPEPISAPNAVTDPEKKPEITTTYSVRRHKACRGADAAPRRPEAPAAPPAPRKPPPAPAPAAVAGCRRKTLSTESRRGRTTPGSLRETRQRRHRHIPIGGAAWEVKPALTGSRPRTNTTPYPPQHHTARPGPPHSPSPSPPPTSAPGPAPGPSPLPSASAPAGLSRRPPPGPALSPPVPRPGPAHPGHRPGHTSASVCGSPSAPPLPGSLPLPHLAPPAPPIPFHLRHRPLPPPPAARPARRPAPLTVWECRLWLASICAVSGTVSSSSTLPAGGFSMKAIPGRGTGARRRQPASRGSSRRGRRCQHGSAATPPPGLSAADRQTDRQTDRRRPLGGAVPRPPPARAAVRGRPAPGSERLRRRRRGPVRSVPRD